MIPVGATQPRLPTAIAIPKNWHLIITDLKDCFFTIPLHPTDCHRFAFSVPSTNLEEPSALTYNLELPRPWGDSVVSTRWLLHGCRNIWWYGPRPPIKIFTSISLLLPPANWSGPCLCLYVSVWTLHLSRCNTPGGPQDICI